MSSFKKGKLSRLFIGAAIGTGALTIHFLTDDLARLLTDNHTPVQINAREKLGSSFNVTNSGKTNEAATIAQPQESVITMLPEDIEKDIPAKLTSDDIRGHMGWARLQYYQFQTSNEPDFIRYQYLQAAGSHFQEWRPANYDLLEALKEGMTEEEYLGKIQEDYFKEIGTTKTQYYTDLNAYAVKAIKALQQDILIMPPGDSIKKYAYLVYMQNAYKNVGVMPNGYKFVGEKADIIAYEATNLTWDDIYTQMNDLRTSTAIDAYSVLTQYQQRTPTTSAEWEHYENAMMALEGYHFDMDKGAKENRLLQAGITDDVMKRMKEHYKSTEDIRSEDFMLKSRQKYAELLKSGINSPSPQTEKISPPRLSSPAGKLSQTRHDPA